MKRREGNGKYGGKEQCLNVQGEQYASKVKDHRSRGNKRMYGGISTERGDKIGWGG